MKVCVRCGQTAAHKHHRKRRSQGGDDSPANLIDLCARCHDWVHNNVAKALQRGYLVRSHNNPADVPIVNMAGVILPGDPVEHDHTGTCKVCGVEIRKKVTKPRFQGEKRRQRRVIAIRVPDDWEDGGAVWDETLEQVKKELVIDGLYDDDERIPNYEAVIAGLRDYIDTRPLVRQERS